MPVFIKRVVEPGSSCYIGTFYSCVFYKWMSLGVLTSVARIKNIYNKPYSRNLKNVDNNKEKYMF